MEASSPKECPLPNATSRNPDSDEIRFVPAAWEHYWSVLGLTLREFPCPENFMAFLMFLVYGLFFGVVGVDSDNRVAGYFLGMKGSKYGWSRKKTGNLVVVCVSSRHQNRGVAKNMGKYMMEGKHPDFDPKEYDEILLQDTDTWNSPSWLFSDRTGFRYCPTHEMIRVFGFTGYIQILLEGTHITPCQFMKRYVKTEEEAREADEFERQKGILACLISGIVPSVYWVVHWIIRCDTGVRVSFVGMVFGVTYFLLFVRFALAHSVTARDKSLPKVVFREYDIWWSPYMFFWPLAIFLGIPLLGWTGGFYLGEPGLNYLTKENRRALGKIYLPVNLLTLALFVAYGALCLAAPGVLLAAGGLLDVLGTAAFFFSITDLAMPTLAFPSGAMATRRRNIYVFGLIWVLWCVTLAVTITSSSMTQSKLGNFLDLSHAACKVA